MTVNTDELGPVDWIVVEFPGTKLTGEIAPIIQDYVDQGLIKVGGAVVVAHGINRRGARREDRRDDRRDC